MASPFRLRKSSRDESQSERDNRVRTENIKAGRGNSTAEHKGKFKSATPKGAAREEMSGKSDAPARKKSTPKRGAVKSTSPFRKTPETNIPTPTPRPNPSMYNVPQTPSWAGTETAPPPAPSFTPPFNPQMSDASRLHTVPPELQAPMPFAHAGTETAPRPMLAPPMGPAPGNAMAGMETAPRPGLPSPFAQLGGPGGPATSPFTGGQTGPGPGVDQAKMLQQLLFGR